MVESTAWVFVFIIDFADKFSMIKFLRHAKTFRIVRGVVKLAELMLLATTCLLTQYVAAMPRLIIILHRELLNKLTELRRGDFSLTDELMDDVCYQR